MKGALIEPDSLDQAEELYEQAVEDLQAIQQQLGDRDRTVNGQRMDSREYFQWRRKAMAALRFASDEVRYYKQAMKDYRRQEADDETRVKLRVATNALSQVCGVCGEGGRISGMAARRRLEAISGLAGEALNEIRGK